MISVDRSRCLQRKRRRMRPPQKILPAPWRRKTPSLPPVLDRVGMRGAHRRSERPLPHRLLFPRDRVVWKKRTMRASIGNGETSILPWKRTIPIRLPRRCRPNRTSERLFGNRLSPSDRHRRSAACWCPICHDRAWCRCSRSDPFRHLYSFVAERSGFNASVSPLRGRLKRIIVAVLELVFCIGVRAPSLLLEWQNLVGLHKNP
mmetsp:Transcript_36843/g.55084  ORF Transcript_36843/g.55084 Transcript_36843/m.55084 type:complete len:204 (-) Transcript_36843:948-1559(-)